jgi:predicted transcriptional regulator
MRTVIADVLVTRSGGRWEGKVTESGTDYVLVRPDGSKMSFPKDVVKEVVIEGQSAARQSGVAGTSAADEAIKGMRGKLIQARGSLNEAIVKAKQRHADERKIPKDGSEVVLAQVRLEKVQKMASEIKRTGAKRMKESIEVTYMGQKRMLDVETSRETWQKDVADAKRGLAEANEGPPELLEKQKRELDAYGTVGVMLNNIELVVGEAARAVKAVEDNPAHLQAPVEQWSERVDALIQVCQSELLGMEGPADRSGPQVAFEVLCGQVLRLKLAPTQGAAVADACREARRSALKAETPEARSAVYELACKKLREGVLTGEQRDRLK